MSQQPFKIVESSQKQMPCNIEAEQAVIASVLVSNDIFDEISPILDSQKFFDPIHVKLYETIEKLIFPFKKFDLTAIEYKPFTRFTIAKNLDDLSQNKLGVLLNKIIRDRKLGSFIIGAENSHPKKSI